MIFEKAMRFSEEVFDGSISQALKLPIDKPEETRAVNSGPHDTLMVLEERGHGFAREQGGCRIGCGVVFEERQPRFGANPQSILTVQGKGGDGIVGETARDVER